MFLFFLLSKYEEKNIKEKFNFANKQYFLCRLHLKLSNVCISKAGTIPNIIIFLHVIPTNKGDSNSCVHTFFTQLRNLINTIMSKNILLKTSLTALGCIVINADLIIKGGKRKDEL